MYKAKYIVSKDIFPKKFFTTTNNLYMPPTNPTPQKNKINIAASNILLSMKNNLNIVLECLTHK